MRRAWRYLLARKLAHQNTEGGQRNSRGVAREAENQSKNALEVCAV